MKKGLLLFVLISIFTAFSSVAQAYVRGIYITQSVAENTKRLTQLIRQSKAVGINTFVVDLWRAGPRYRSNLEMIKNNGIRVVSRVVIFPHGGTDKEIKSQVYVDKKLNLLKRAVALKVNAVQLDYIRYNTKLCRDENAKNVYKVIQYYKDYLIDHHVPMEIDVFGVALHRPAVCIGQDVKMFADSVDALCPMTYPSHYRDHAKTSELPFLTVFTSLTKLSDMFGGYPPFKLIPWVEVYNFRYPMSAKKRIEYMSEQMRAAREIEADGWYAWSANNKYALLFQLLKQRRKHANLIIKLTHKNHWA